VALWFNGEKVGEMEKATREHGAHIHVAEQQEVVLEQSYPVQCIVHGGNPPPAVNLSSGGTEFSAVY